MVVGIVTHFFQVVVLPGHAKAFLGVSDTRAFHRGIPEENVFELIHTRIGEHEGRIILDNHRGRRDDLV
jgi:hypothetical protein